MVEYIPVKDFAVDQAPAYRKKAICIIPRIKRVKRGTCRYKRYRDCGRDYKNSKFNTC